MAIFDIKAVVDPLAKELRESYGEIRSILMEINAQLELQSELTQTTNRLLAALVEQGKNSKAPSDYPRTIKTPAVKP